MKRLTVADGVDVGLDVGFIETVGLAEGVLVGVFVGVRVGLAEGEDVGFADGEDEGLAVGVADGVEVGCFAENGCINNKLMSKFMRNKHFYTRTEADGCEDGFDVGETVGSTLMDGALLMEGAADTCSKQKSHANGQASLMLTSFSNVIPPPIVQYNSRRRSTLFSFFVIHSHPRSLSGFNLFLKV